MNRMPPHAKSYVLTGNCVDNIIRWCTQELSDDRELVDVILSREQWLALQHLCEDTPSTPDINLDIVFLPCQHDLRCSVVSGRDISGHLRILDAGQTEIADLKITVLVDKDVAGLQIAMNDTGRVHIFKTTLQKSAILQIWAQHIIYQDLVQEILDKLLLKRSRCEQAVEISS